MIDLLYDCYCNKRLKTFETFIASAFDTSPLQAVNKICPNSKNVKTEEYLSLFSESEIT